jgi:hypothetical protein
LWSKVTSDDGSTSFITSYGGYVTFTFSSFSIPNGATNISVSIVFTGGRFSANAGAVNGCLKIGGSYYSGTGNYLSSVNIWTWCSNTWNTNPQTGSAWTVDQINGVGNNALQHIGMDAEWYGMVSYMRADVSYTDPPPTFAFGIGGGGGASSGGINSPGAYGSS